MTKRKCLNCKVSKETKTNYTRIPSGSYNNICIECKEKVKNKPLTCYVCRKKKPREELINQKCKDCRKVSYNKGSMRTTRKCTKCKESRCSNTDYTHSRDQCNLCVSKRSTTNKCKHCGERKPKEMFATEGLKKRSNKCDDCKANPKKRGRKALENRLPTKKTPEVIKHRVGSYEEANTIKLTAADALIRAKKQEAELLESGKLKAERGGIRSIIYKKV